MLVLLAVGCGSPSFTEEERATLLGEYVTWQITGGADRSSDDRAFLPLPAGVFDEATTFYVGSMDTTLAKGDVFYLPVYTWTGEEYEDGTVDDQAYPADEAFLDSTITVTYDGEPLIDSAEDDLADFYVPLVELAATVPYATPTDYGSVGAVWVRGLGITADAGGAGTKTLSLEVDSAFLADNFGFAGYQNTWTITVE